MGEESPPLKSCRARTALFVAQVKPSKRVCRAALQSAAAHRSSLKGSSPASSAMMRLVKPPPGILRMTLALSLKSMFSFASSPSSTNPTSSSRPTSELTRSPMGPGSPGSIPPEWLWWVTVLWYHHEHRHTALQMLTPFQVHAGQGPRLLAERAEVRQQTLAARLPADRQAEPRRPLLRVTAEGPGASRNASEVGGLSWYPPKTAPRAPWGGPNGGGRLDPRPSADDRSLARAIRSPQRTICW